jgi:hypothetical protein
VIWQSILPLDWVTHASRPPTVEPPLQGRYDVLARAASALRRGDLREVERLANAAGGLSAGDAARLNLLGVVSEALGRAGEARRLYGKAMRADRAFLPAQQNLRRLYELQALGRTTCPVAVGDTRTDLWLARRTRLPPRRG